MTKRLSILATFVILLLVVPATPASALCIGVCPPQSEPAPSQPSSSQPAPSQPSSSQPAPSQPSSAPTKAAPSRAGVDAAGTARILELVNQERANAGLPPMSARSEAASIAQGHSQAMAERGEIWHNDAYFTSAVRQRLGAKGLGENVAMNGTVDGAHRGLMNSAGHRANILRPGFTVVGMSVVRDARGVVYVTQNFVEPLSGGAAPKAAGAPVRTPVRPTSRTMAAAPVQPVSAPQPASPEVLTETVGEAEVSITTDETSPVRSTSGRGTLYFVGLALFLGVTAFAITAGRRRLTSVIPQGRRPALAAS